MNEIETINISSEIFKKIEEKIRDPLVGFEKVEDYIKFVLEKALDIESKSTKTEDEKVEEKLRQLGYI